MGPSGGAQEVSEHHSGLTEGQVSHQDVRCGWQGLAEEVAVDDLGPVAEPLLEVLGQALVDLHDGEGSSQTGQGFGEGAGAGSDLDDRSAGLLDASDDRVQGGLVV